MKSKTRKKDGRFCEGCDRCHDCGKPKAEHLMCPRERPQPVRVYPDWNYPWWGRPVIYRMVGGPRTAFSATAPTTGSYTATSGSTTAAYALLAPGRATKGDDH